MGDFFFFQIILELIPSPFFPELTQTHEPFWPISMASSWRTPWMWGCFLSCLPVGGTPLGALLGPVVHALVSWLPSQHASPPGKLGECGASASSLTDHRLGGLQANFSSIL